MLKFDINLLFTVINLFVLFFIVWKFLFKPVRKILEARQEEADKLQKQAMNREQEAAAAKARYDKCLTDTEEERKQILAKARKQADDEYKKIVNNAKNTAKRIEAEANEEAERSKARILSDAEQEIADMIASATEKNIGTRTGEKVDQALYNQFLNEVGENK